MKNYGANLSEQNLKKSFKILEQVYQEVPKTKGCEKANSKNECGAYCCRLQSPSMYLCEFLYLWEHFTKHSTKDQFLDVVLAAVKNYLKSTVTKGCVFFDEKTCMCKIHDQRAYNCRIYGITPDEEFNPRYEKLKKEYKSIIGAVIKPQCDLITTVDGKKVTVFDTNRWWNELVNIESSIGIPKDMITDKMGGSYRTPHDHILLYNMPENVLNSLAGIKEYNDEIQKKIMIKEIIQVIRNVFTSKS